MNLELKFTTLLVNATCINYYLFIFEDLNVNVYYFRYPRYPLTNWRTCYSVQPAANITSILELISRFVINKYSFAFESFFIMDSSRTHVMAGQGRISEDHISITLGNSKE